jgi:hypothetical protein
MSFFSALDIHQLSARVERADNNRARINRPDIDSVHQSG